MKFIQNDGGRQLAGYKGKAGDCVTRAIAIVAGLPYTQVYQALAMIEGERHVTKRMKKRVTRSARNGVYTQRKAFKDYMASLGFTWTPTMLIGQGCKVHLRADELPRGRLVVCVSRHYTAVLDGVIHDTHNPAADRGTTIYPRHTPLDMVPKNAQWLENGNGWAYNPERCVYGYWTFQQENES